MLYYENLDVISLKAIPLNVYKKMCGPCIPYIVLFAAFLIKNTIISSAFIYFHLYLKKDNVHIKFNSVTQTTIY